MASSATIHVGPSFAGLLGLAFIVLKLTGHITWSWWWVLAPFWMPVVILLGFLVLAGLGYAVVAYLGSR